MSPLKAVTVSDPQQDIHLEAPAPSTPYWLLEGDYGSPRWVVRDDNPRSPQPARVIRFDLIVYDPLRSGETCRLTDPEYAHLLDTVRRMGYALRIGKYATHTTAMGHEVSVRYTINWISWMLLNGIRRFSDLSKDDFNSYANEIVYGPSRLLRYVERIKQHYDALKKRTASIPTRGVIGGKPRLDIPTLLKSAGIDPVRAFYDKAAMYELCKIAKAEGFYLKRNQIAQLAKQPPEPRRLSSSGLISWLQPWLYQWNARRVLPGDRIQFNPFEEVSLLRKCKELGKSGGRTKTAPVRQTMELIDHCIRWVLNYAPLLLEIREQYEDALAEHPSDFVKFRRLGTLISSAGFEAGPGSPASLLPSTRYYRTRGIDFGTAIRLFIPIACLVVICAFSGRRHIEALSIRAKGPDNADCISREGEGWWIETYIAKTLQDWDKTPCNEIVVAAVKILERWSAPARAISNDVRLFQYATLETNKVMYITNHRHFNLFVNFLSLTPLPDGSQWVFTPHQFRRFFAILYFWRYQYGNLAALSHHLRHLNPAMTLRYLTEEDSGAIFRHVGKEFTTTVLTEAALGERNISGNFGERFKATARKLRQHFRRVVKVVSPRLVGRLVERYVERSGRRLRAMPWGYCFCGTLPHQLQSAKCLEHNPAPTSAGPDSSNSSPTTCANCQHHVTEVVFEPFVRNELKFHEQAAADPENGPLLRETSRKHAQILRRHCERSFEKSQPLEGLDD